MNSVWENTQKMPSFPKLESATKTDVLIVGGGMAGVLTAFMLEKAGVDYLLIEQNRICGGTTGNTTAKITSQHGLIYNKLLGTYGAEFAYLYWQSNEDAIERYRSLCRDIPCGFEEKSNFIYSVGGNDNIPIEMNALKKLNIPAFCVKETPLPFFVDGAVEFRNQAQFNPLEFAAGIAKGLNIRENTRALEFRKGAVVTDCGSVTAKRIVLSS